MPPVNVLVNVDDVRCAVVPGLVRASALRERLEIRDDRWLSLQEADFERFVGDDEQIVVHASLRLSTCSPLIYLPHPKHKRDPARGPKGSICPNGVHGPTLLAHSYRLHAKPRRRWATHDGLAYCAMDDNAGGWHGYPVAMTQVPAPIWRHWLSCGKISTRDLKTATIPKR